MTTRRAWAVLVALAVVVGGGVGWAAFARIDSTVALDGLLLAGSGPTLVNAPATGTIQRVVGSAGQSVQVGDPLFVVRVGDRETTVPSPAAGVVTAIRFTAGDPVSAGALVATVEAPGQSLGAALFTDAARPLQVRPGTRIRGNGLTGVVSAVDVYPASEADVARRLGVASLPGNGGMVRTIFVHFDVAAWPGASLTPVRLEAVVASRSPGRVLLGGV